MPTQDIVEEFPSDFETLILYTGNVMKTSVGGRNSVFHKKSNFEVIQAMLYFEKVRKADFCDLDSRCN